MLALTSGQGVDAPRPTAGDRTAVIVQADDAESAAAVVSGVAALLLEAEPTLTPDDVKCRLLATADPATDSSDAIGYSVFQQGAGMVNAYDAVFSTAGSIMDQTP